MGKQSQANIKKSQKAENYWNLRNNSSNVSGLLNSEIHTSNNDIESNFALSKTRRITLVSNHCYKSALQNKTQTAHCEECYCNKSPVQSKFNSKLDDQEPEIPFIPKFKKPNDQHCSYSLNADGFHSSASEEYRCLSANRVTTRKIKKKIICPMCGCNKHDCGAIKKDSLLNYTTPRQEYERFKTSKEIEEFPDSLEGSKNNDEIKTTECENVNCKDSSNDESQHSKTRGDPVSQQSSSTLLGKGLDEDNDSRHFTFFKSSTDARANLKKLNSFRKENYFDCYAANINTDSNEHKCIHRFSLNDRLIPRPLNADPFGMSRCVICYKPMQLEVPKPSTDIVVANDRYKKGYKNSEPIWDSKIPKQVTITNNNERIEIKIPFNVNQFVDLLNSGSGSIALRKPIPVNSLALRHQRFSM